MTRLHPIAAAVVLLVGIAGCSSSSENRAGSERSSTTRAPLPPSTVAAPASATVTQPAQRTSGPGSSALTNADWRVSAGGSGADAWFVFEPSGPAPRTAPVTVIMHGYGEYAGYDTMYELIRHTVRTGSIVVYPRWQTAIATPCPGPIDIEPCMTSAVNGIRGALAFLQADPSRVQPELDDASYFGFSFGGIITANLANRYRDLDLPKPKAIFVDDLHDGGLDGLGEPALDDSLAGIPSTVLLECHVGAEGVISEDATGGCNALFPKLDHIPTRRKAIVLTHPDDHGQPELSSEHGVCTARRDAADAYDWNFCWKVWDALRGAEADDDLRRAIGGAVTHTDNGEWSDGLPIAPLVVQSSAPIRP